MEFALLRISHPSWLTLQLPAEVVELIRFRPKPPSGEPGRSITFLARGHGIARVVSTDMLREALAVEAIRDRMIAASRPGEKFLISVPAALLRHLEMEVGVRGPRSGRGTDDRILWFVPVAEYREYQACVNAGRAWDGPAGGGEAHVYLTKAEWPVERAIAQLGDLERRIEYEEWKPAVAALQRVARAR